MPDDSDNEALNSDDISQVREALKREQKRRKDLETEAAEAANARRELTFLRAGVDDSSPVGRLFVKGYDGELDVEAIKAAWTEIAPPPAAPPAAPNGETPPATPEAPQNQGLTEEELEELRRRRQNFSSESTPPGAEPNKPLGRDIMDTAFEAQNPGGVRARPPTGMDDRALNAGFSRLFARANEDDQEAIFKRPTETWADATERWRRSKA